MVRVLRKYLGGDPVIWVVILALTIYSLLAVYSSTGSLAYRFQGGNTAYYILKHSTFLLLGLFMIFVTHMIHYKYYSRLSQLFLIIAVPLLAITLLFGENINEASRWLQLPGTGISFQTSDFAKLALIMYVARLLSLKQDQIKSYHAAFLPIIVPVLLVCGLILPANLSTASILFVTCLLLMYIGRINIRHLALTGFVGALLLTVFILIALNWEKEGRIGTWKARIESYLDPDDEGNYQVKQSKIAIASGGLLGKGPGNSTQRNYLPHPYSDFIFAIIVEEYGLFFGGLPIILLYLILLYRAGVIVRKSHRTFPAFLSIGLMIGLVFQAFVNMGVAVDLLPTTGQTLPLVSMGGTSLLFTSMSLGIVLSVSRALQEQDQNEQTEFNPDEGSST